MTRWVACVPNVVEGRRPEIIEEIAEAIRAVPGVHLIDQVSDPDHNRTVYTLVGAPKDLLEGAHACLETALRLVKCPDEDGVHPWRGPVDVVPFVPLAGATIEDAVRLAHSLGRRVQGIDVAFYGAASPTGEALPELRKRLEGRRNVLCIGAREPLIAFNVQLESEDLAAAREIARELRALPALRALAFALRTRGCVQVSLNLLDWRRTSPLAALREVERLAKERGIAVRDTEFTGMVPREAALADLREALRAGPIRLLDPAPDFLDALAARTPAPAGVSAAAFTGAMGAALLAMTAPEPPQRKRAEELRRRLRALVDEDAEAFAAHLRSRDAESLRAATETPVRAAEACAEVARLGEQSRAGVARPMASDHEAAIRLARAALGICVDTARGNLSRLSDDSFAAAMRSRLDVIF